MKSNLPTIPQLKLGVKFSALKMVMLCTLLLSNSAFAKSFFLDPEKVRVDQFESHANYLSLPLLFEPVAEVRKNLESKLRVNLKNRGEAHITVITPPEFQILEKKLKIEDINKIALQEGILKSDLKFICVGKGQTVPELSTYYIVVKSKNLLRIREKIHQEWLQRKGQGEFRPEKFYPHITLGFTEKDLHESDGVIKDERSCLPDMPAL